MTFSSLFQYELVLIFSCSVFTKQRATVGSFKWHLNRQMVFYSLIQE